MTENEVIEELKAECTYGDFKCEECEGCVNQTAIKAIEELQQYRAIGTVEELKAIKKGTLSAIELVDIWCVLENLKKYEAIGTIDEFKALKEKNEPKKPLHNGANWYRCPNGCEVHKKHFEKDWYCPKCGTKIDWSE